MDNNTTTPEPNVIEWYLYDHLTNNARAYGFDINLADDCGTLTRRGKAFTFTSPVEMEEFFRGYKYALEVLL